jgi:serine/threonine-protein kinase
VLDIGAMIDGRYRVEATLGEGGLARVYRVTRVQLGTTHALKVLKQDSSRVRERLFREGQLQGKLRHPNIAAVTDLVEVDGRPALVMEFVRGASLDDLLASETLTLEQIDHLAQGIIRGVAAAHAHHILHRDLKPANVLLEVVDGVPTPKITDFGLAKALDQPSDTLANMKLGTPQYMSAEQITDASSVDHRADVWAVGVMLYELVSGHRPFESPDVPGVFQRILNDDREPVRALVPTLPARMEAAIEGALVKDRHRRIQTMDELLRVWTGSDHQPRAGGFTDSVLGRVLERGQGGTAGEPVAPGEQGVYQTFALDPEVPRSPDTFPLEAPQPAGPRGAAGVDHDASTVEAPAVTLPGARPPPPAPPSRVRPWVVGGVLVVVVVGAMAVASVSVLGLAGAWWWLGS